MALNVNPEEIPEEENNFDDDKPVPPGRYLCHLESQVDEEETQAKNGNVYSRIRLRFRILEGEQANRCLFHDAIYAHPTSEMAEKIGLSFLKQIFAAGDCEGNICPESLLQAKPVVCTTKVEESEGYKPRARIKRVLSGDGAVHRPAAVQEAATGDSPSW